MKIPECQLTCYYFENQDGIGEIPLKFLLEKHGNYHSPPHIERYIDRELGILKIKAGKNLIRIAFYTPITDRCRVIVLLNVFEKPALYEKAKKRKVDKEVQSALDKAESYRDNYIPTGNAVPCLAI